MNYAHVTIVDDEGVRRNFPKAWLTDPARRSVERIVYEPGGAKVVDGDYYNMWTGMGAEPVKGDCAPWLDVLSYGIPDAKTRAWVLQWLAWPLQHAGAKLNTFIHLYGPPGAGKNALLAPILGIYGANAITLGRERLASDFNSVYAHKQFINLDEMHGGTDKDALAITNKIKMLVTGEHIVVNTKGSVEYTVRNHVNLVTTSNYSDSIKLDEGDRRALVQRFGSRTDVPKGAAYWEAYFTWAQSEDGVSALYDYLLGVDMAGFDPLGVAPMTTWKEQVTDSTRSAMEKWVRDLWEDPTLVLPALMVDCKALTPEQLAHAYSPEENARTQGLKNALGKHMTDMGFTRVEVKVEGRKVRMWVLDRVATPTNEQIRADYVKVSNLLRGKF